jgi:hypothetical protein
MSIKSFRRHLIRACAVGAVGLIASAAPRGASAATIFTDGFGDGDRDNNGLDAGATATDATDTGLAWYLTNGTSAITLAATDDSAGIGSGNALQLFNTASNNRPVVGRMPSAVALGDGESLVLRFDMRLLSTKNTSGVDITADRAIRFGLYNDTANDFVAGDQSSTSTMYNDDNGYNSRVDAGNDVSNSTSMDVTRDADGLTTSIIQATTTGIGVSSTNAADKLDDVLSHHFELTLTRSGTGMVVSLIQDGGPAISNTDASPPGFTFNEVAFGVRSNAAMDLRIDNVSVEHVIPEPAGLAAIGLAATGLLGRRKRR